MTPIETTEPAPLTPLGRIGLEHGERFTIFRDDTTGEYLAFDPDFPRELCPAMILCGDWREAR